MSTEKPNNPSAFPLEYQDYTSSGRLCQKKHLGMTLRDYFAN